VSSLYPLLARDRYCDEEWEYATSGRCDREVEYGNGRGIIRCGLPSSPASFYRWCDEHDLEARYENPAAYGK
jgi:hypothetical protein